MPKRRFRFDDYIDWDRVSSPLSSTSIFSTPSNSSSPSPSSSTPSSPTTSNPPATSGVFFQPFSFFIPRINQPPVYNGDFHFLSFNTPINFSYIPVACPMSFHAISQLPPICHISAQPGYFYPVYNKMEAPASTTPHSDASSHRTSLQIKKTHQWEGIPVSQQDPPSESIIKFLKNWAEYKLGKTLMQPAPLQDVLDDFHSKGKHQSHSTRSFTDRIIITNPTLFQALSSWGIPSL